jgi:hypothetical protein
MPRRTSPPDQQNLFGFSEPELMRRRVKELDRGITLAMKQKQFDRAKEMADEQAALIRKLVEMGEKS